MESKVVSLSSKDIENAAENKDKQKVYYEYVSDTVEKNMPASDVGEMIRRLRLRFEEEQKKEGFSVREFKNDLYLDADVAKFAREHPRIFDATISRYTSTKDLEMMQQMVQFRQAVEQGLLTELQAKAALNELLLHHNKRPAGTDREKMADDRIARKVEEGSFLGFDPESIPELKRAAEPYLSKLNVSR